MLSERLVADVRSAANDLGDAVDAANYRANMYRTELRRVNRAQRLLKLEYKELKQKYDAVVSSNKALARSMELRVDDDGIPF